ncbi:MAG TPA: 2-hydroxyacid dehydrogenase [Nocardioidaceae bacterium]
MKVFLPFPAEELDLPSSVTAHFEIEYADATEHWPDTAGECEFYVPSYRFNRRVVEVMEDMPSLRVVQTLTAGVDHLLPYVPDGVTVCNAAGVHDAATSELAVGLIIGAQRRLAELVRAQDRHIWDQQMAGALADRHVLVIGAGNIGRAIERRLAGFECSVTLVGRTARHGVRAVAELPGLLPDADVVVLIIPITDETRGLVDREFLAPMKDGALLVNVARGPIVVTDDLLAEVSTGRLRAALDVTDPEPLPPDHPLWDASGVVITPHVGGASDAMWPRSYRLVGQQLSRLAAGEPLLNQVG